jgi:hypothetical protein
VSKNGARSRRRALSILKENATSDAFCVRRRRGKKGGSVCGYDKTLPTNQHNAVTRSVIQRTLPPCRAALPECDAAGGISGFIIG